MTEPQAWFENFFVAGGYASVLADIPPDRTARETQFIAGALRLPPGSRILDLCCGVGRHSIALADQGYEVVGVDLNESALDIARQRAKEAGVKVQFVCADMRNIPFSGELNAVINIFSSFGYYETDDEDGQVLRAVAKALRDGGRFLIDTQSRGWLFRRFRESEWREEADGSLVLARTELDLLTSRYKTVEKVLRPDGRQIQRPYTFRSYTLTELAQLMRSAGLEPTQTWGDFDGSPYSLESRRMIVLAKKTA
jgi:ubiquinone/menaquinone biosynthesis C-methylase UbiE